MVARIDCYYMVACAMRNSMLHFAAPCCAVRCAAPLCYTALHCSFAMLAQHPGFYVLRCAVLCCAALCCAVLCCAVLCCAVLRCAALQVAQLCCVELCFGELRCTE